MKLFMIIIKFQNFNMPPLQLEIGLAFVQRHQKPFSNFRVSLSLLSKLNSQFIFLFKVLAASNNCLKRQKQLPGKKIHIGSEANWLKVQLRVELKSVRLNLKQLQKRVRGKKQPQDCNCRGRYYKATKLISYQVVITSLGQINDSREPLDQNGEFKVVIHVLKLSNFSWYL